jgi:hypothetical protein
MPFTARISSPEKYWVFIVNMFQWLNVKVFTFEREATTVWGLFNKTHLLCY